MAFLFAGGIPIFDRNMGKVEFLVVTKEFGSVQITGALRLNEQYLEDSNLLACLSLEDRFLRAVQALGSSQTYQETFGYPPCNFIDPAAIVML